MVNIKIGGSVDIQKIHRLQEENEVLIGYPDGVQHPVYVGHKHTPSGKISKKRAFSVLLSNLPNADLARALHNGTRYTPSRPFLYDAIISVRQELREKLRKVYHRKIERGEEGEENNGEFSFEGIGAFVVGAVQRLVRGGYYKGVMKNADSTIARKGSDTPLIDTGFLMQSTTYITRKHPPKMMMKKVEISGEAGPK